MTHALDEAVCDCTCRCCRELHPAVGRTAERALAAATAVEGTDPYPGFTPAALLDITPVQVGGVIRRVGQGCARKAFEAERPGLADMLLPLIPEGTD
jgi:hypothetical protein